MLFTPELIAEMEVLALYSLDSIQEGIKVHNNAAPEKIAAAQRLHDKGLTDQPDGGYLTSLGIDAAQQVQQLLIILKTAQPA